MPSLDEGVQPEPSVNPAATAIPESQQSPSFEAATISVEDRPVESSGAPDDALEGHDNEWHELLPKLKLMGMALQLAEHCLLQSRNDEQITLLLDNTGTSLQTHSTVDTLNDALHTFLGHSVQLNFEVTDKVLETPEKRRIRVARELQLQAERAIENDPFVQQLQREWGGVILPGSVRPNQSAE